MTTPASARPDAELRLTAYNPPPPVRADEPLHQSLKLDWHSEVGRTGILLDWWPVGRGVDAGVPDAIAGAITAALCSAGTVVGCTLAVPESAGPAWMAVPGGHAMRFPSRRWPRKPPLGLLASRDPGVIVRLFGDDEDALSWALETQTFFVAPPDALPYLDRDLVEGCLDLPIRATVAQLAAANVVALLCAGVDGDVAGLYTPEPGVRARIVQALADAAAAAGARWGVRDGAEHWSVRARATPRGGTTA